MQSMPLLLGSTLSAQHQRLFTTILLTCQFTQQQGIIYTNSPSFAQILLHTHRQLFPQKKQWQWFSLHESKSQQLQLLNDFAQKKIPVLLSEPVGEIALTKLSHLAFIIYAYTPLSLAELSVSLLPATKATPPSKAWLLTTPADYYSCLEKIKKLPIPLRPAALDNFHQVLTFCHAPAPFRPAGQSRWWQKSYTQIAAKFFPSKSWQQLFQRKLAFCQTLRTAYAKQHQLREHDWLPNLSLHYLSLLDWQTELPLAHIPGIGQGFQNSSSDFFTALSSKPNSVFADNLSNADDIKTKKGKRSIVV